MKKPFPIFFLILLVSFFSSPAVASSNPATIPSVPNIATLEALGPASAQYPVVSVQNYSVAGGGGIFNWIAGSSSAPDSCTIFAANGVSSGRWKRQLADPNAIDVTMCGADPTGGTGSAAAFNLATAWASANNGKVVVSAPVSNSNYLVDGAVTIGSNVAFECQGAPNLLYSSGYLQIGSGSAVANASLRNCNIDGNSQLNIGVRLCGQLNHVQITGNYIANTSHGINSLCSGTSINDVVVENNQIFNTSAYGFLLNSSNGVTGPCASLIISKNTIIGFQSDGIELNFPSGSCNGAVINSNTINWNSAGGSSGSSGFAIGVANVSYIAVKGNILGSCRQECIHLEGTQHSDIEGNIINQGSTGKNGIILISSSVPVTTQYVSLRGNNITCSGSGNTGIFEDSTNRVFDTTIDGNILTNCANGILANQDAVVIHNLIAGGAIGILTTGGVVSGQFDGNIFDSVTQIYQTQLGGEFGSTYLRGTIPTTFSTTTGSGGIANFHNIYFEGTGSASSGANALAVFPAPFTFMGTADAQVENTSVRTQHVSGYVTALYTGLGSANWVVPVPTTGTFAYSFANTFSATAASFIDVDAGGTNVVLNFTVPSSVGVTYHGCLCGILRY